MIDGLTPYPEYKDSGQRWIGKIPSHWKVLPNRALFEEIRERGHADEEMLSVTIKRGVIKQKELLSESSKKDSSNLNKAAYKLVCPGDIAYNKMRAWQGAVGLSKYRGIVSPAYIVMRFREIHNSHYFHYLFRTPSFTKEAERWSYGITSDMWSLRPYHFKMIYTPLPPMDEQDAIVRFINHTTRILNRAIHSKQQVISLLNEQKQVIINKTITGGLDPNASLINTEIPWIGDIPKHYQLVALRRYCQVIDCKHVTVPFMDDGYPLASIVETQSFYLDLKKSKKTPYVWYKKIIEGDRKPKRGDIIFCRNVSVGATTLVNSDIDFAMGQDVCIIRTKKLEPKFLNYIFHSKVMATQIESLLVGATFRRINVAQIKSLQIIIPSLREQKKICDYLDNACNELSTIIENIEKQIFHLRELRIRLTADVVTGNIDIRNLAEGLPDSIEDIEEVSGLNKYIDEKISESEAMREAYG